MSRTIKRPRRYETEKPVMSEATLATIRAAAHRYVLAGGTVFGPLTASDVDELSLAGTRSKVEP